MGDNTLTLLQHNRAQIVLLMERKTGAGDLFRLRAELQEIDRALALLRSDPRNEKPSVGISDQQEPSEKIDKTDDSVRDYLTNKLASENLAGDPPAGRKQVRRYAYLSNPVSSRSSRF